MTSLAGAATQGQLVGKEHQSVANDVLDKITRLVDHSQRVVDHIEDKLLPVMRQPGPPTPDVLRDHEAEREYPPLFKELKDKIEIIDNSLSKIDYALSRAEL